MCSLSQHTAKCLLKNQKIILKGFSVDFFAVINARGIWPLLPCALAAAHDKAYCTRQRHFPGASGRPLCRVPWRWHTTKALFAVCSTRRIWSKKILFVYLLPHQNKHTNHIYIPRPSQITFISQIIFRAHIRHIYHKSEQIHYNPSFKCL